MMRHFRIAVHTKACVQALGARAGLETIARAGFTTVVIWPGENGEFLDSVGLADRLGLSVAYVALPKMWGLRDRPEHVLAPWVARIVATGVSRISLIFGDPVNPAPRRIAWARLASWLSSSEASLAIENCGRPTELFARPTAIASLLARVPPLRATLDLGHLAASGHAEADVTTLLERVSAVEGHDNDGTADLHLPLGHGSGAGCACDLLRRLPDLPELLVVETDPRQAAHPRLWRQALQADRERMGAAADSLGVLV